MAPVQGLPAVLILDTLGFMAFEQCFPTLIFQKAVLPPKSKLMRELVEEAQLIAKKDQAGLKWSQTNYPKGFTSYGSLDQLHQFSSSFQALAKRLQPSVNAFIVKSQWDLKPKDLHLTRMWLNVMGPGSSHAFHLHPHSVLSGSFYLQMPRGSAGIKFEDPRMSALMARPAIRSAAKPELKNYITLNPQPGQIIMFESWLKHEVPSHHELKPRISVSFNYDWNRQ